MAADPILALRKQTIAAIKSRLVQLGELEHEDAPTQAELAETLGMTRPRLNMLLKEKAAEFSLEALLRIAMSIDLSIKLKLTRPYGND